VVYRSATEVDVLRDGRGKLAACDIFEPTGRANARPMTGSVGTGSRQENASKQKTRAPSDSIGTEKALVDQFDLAIAQAVDAANDFQFTVCDRDA